MNTARLRVSSAMTIVIATALIAIGCQTSSTVTQVSPEQVEAPKCQLSVSGPPMLDASGGASRFSVTAQPECAWNASTSVSWISALLPSSGQGSRDVEFSVAANNGSAREGEIAVNDSRVRVSQRAMCRYELTPSNQPASSGGGTGALNVVTAAECSWNATSEVTWITLRAPLAGSGNGIVNFTVQANSGGERTGTIAIGGQRAVVTQAGAGTPTPSCSFSIAPTSQTIAATGGAGTSVSVTAQSGCAWTAVSNATWITVTSGASGSGNGSVAFTVAANTGGSRNGTMTIAGRTFTVTQSGAAAPPPPPAPTCTYTISPVTQNVGDKSDEKKVEVRTTSGCAWTATSNASWITITEGAADTGNGTVKFRIAANNSDAQRVGTLTIAGLTATVVQRGD